VPCSPSLTMSGHGGSSASLQELMARNEELEYKRIKVTTTSFYILNASHLFIIELQEITTFKLILNDKFL
jgi:hypothetical protein